MNVRPIIGFRRDGRPIHPISGGAPVVTTPGETATRPQPQTTEVTSSDFLAASKRANRPQYFLSGQSFGAQFNQPLPGAPGYLRYYDLTIEASGGANATTNTVAGNTAAASAGDFGAATGPVISTTTPVRDLIGAGVAGIVQFCTVQDAHGTTVFSGPGFDMFRLLPIVSAALGILAASDVNTWSSYHTGGIAVGGGTATTNTGNFRARMRIPFEIVPGYGLLGVGDTNLQPRVNLQLQSSGTLYTTAPGTLPTLGVTLDAAYYTVPPAGIEPPGLGTTMQAVEVTATPTVGSGASNRIAIGRLGGRMIGLMLIARNTNGQRDGNVWPAFGANNRIRLIFDGLTVLDESIEERFDKMSIATGGLLGSINGPAYGTVATGRTFPAGMLFYTWRDYEAAANLGLLDNGLGWVRTQPGTLLELECTPWGTFSNGPATITAVPIVVVPGRGGVSQSGGIVAAA